MKTIVAAVDFSDSTERVLAAARAQAQAFGAVLKVAHVVEPEPAYTAYGFTPDEFPAMHVFQEEARKRATKRLAEVAGPGVETVLLEGSPRQELLEYTKREGADLLVVGTHGHGRVAALLLGSVAEGLVSKALMPTLVVPVREAED